jgi:aspartate/tyrosine/aromatic aminotransferase
LNVRMLSRCLQVKRIARAIYSNPPLHGALLVTTVLTDPALKAQWFSVSAEMSVHDMRTCSAVTRDLVVPVHTSVYTLQCL